VTFDVGRPVVPESFRPCVPSHRAFKSSHLEFSSRSWSIESAGTQGDDTSSDTAVYGIDIAGWLAAEIERGCGEAFHCVGGSVSAPGARIECSALDLYGARCGTLHSMSPSSNLSDGDRSAAVLRLGR